MSGEGPRVVASILTWRGYDATRSCLRALALLDTWPFPTLVVDNASGTGEGERLAAEFGAPVEGLIRDVNDGVPGGYNAAIQWAARLGADHVLLLNNDIELPDPALVERLLQATGPDVAAVGPIVYDPDGSVFSAGGWIDWMRGRGRFWRSARAPSAYDAEWLDGPCLLVSVDAARKIGGLWPGYFMYWEELDWAVRARALGYRLVVQPTTSIVHERGTRTPSMRVRYLMLRNGILFMRRNGSPAQNLSSLAWALLYKSPGMAIRCLRRPRDLVRVPGTVVSAFGWNLVDAVKRRQWRTPADGPAVETMSAR